MGRTLPARLLLVKSSSLNTSLQIFTFLAIDVYHDRAESTPHALTPLSLQRTEKVMQMQTTYTPKTAAILASAWNVAEAIKDRLIHATPANVHLLNAALLGGRLADYSRMCGNETSCFSKAEFDDAVSEICSIPHLTAVEAKFRGHCHDLLSVLSRLTKAAADELTMHDGLSHLSVSDAIDAARITIAQVKSQPNPSL